MTGRIWWYLCSSRLLPLGEVDAAVVVSVDVIQLAPVAGAATAVDEVAGLVVLVAIHDRVVTGEPALGVAHEHHRVCLPHVFDPVVLGFLGWLEPSVAMLTEVGQEERRKCRSDSCAFRR